MKELRFDKLITFYGAWKVSEDGYSVVYHDQAKPPEGNYGLALLGEKVEDGSIECNIRIGATSENIGAFLVFRANGQQDYYAAGIGGFGNAYSILSRNRRGNSPLRVAGDLRNIQPDRDYRVRLVVEGQRVELFIDGVKVVGSAGVTRTQGYSIGLACQETAGPIHFSNFRVDDRKPKAFIVMQFSSPYNEVYRDAIQPLVAEHGFEPIRVDDIDGPGIIINDIRSQIAESSIVIAEMSEANPNVYYEVGMSHALNKPTILLAQRGTKLPFDVGPHRCIFYDNSIPGRARLQESLQRSLVSLIAGIDDGDEITN